MLVTGKTRRAPRSECGRHGTLGGGDLAPTQEKEVDPQHDREGHRQREANYRRNGDESRSEDYTGQEGTKGDLAATG
jgi:hypothetical protein